MQILHTVFYQQPYKMAPSPETTLMYSGMEGFVRDPGFHFAKLVKITLPGEAESGERVQGKSVWIMSRAGNLTLLFSIWWSTRIPMECLHTIAFQAWPAARRFRLRVHIDDS